VIHEKWVTSDPCAQDGMAIHSLCSNTLAPNNKKLKHGEYMASDMDA
jgi:hypothetical protein